jgi:hypothetical protein
VFAFSNTYGFALCFAARAISAEKGSSIMTYNKAHMCGLSYTRAHVINQWNLQSCRNNAALRPFFMLPYSLESFLVAFIIAKPASNYSLLGGC